MDREAMVYQLWGWLLFVLCALLFILSSLQSGSLLMLVASVVFLAACILFLIPLVRQLRCKREDDTGVSGG